MLEEPGEDVDAGGVGDEMHVVEDDGQGVGERCRFAGDKATDVEG